MPVIIVRMIFLVLQAIDIAKIPANNRGKMNNILASLTCTSSGIIIADNTTIGINRKAR